MHLVVDWQRFCYAERYSAMWCIFEGVDCLVERCIGELHVVDPEKAIAGDDSTIEMRRSIWHQRFDDNNRFATM